MLRVDLSSNDTNLVNLFSDIYKNKNITLKDAILKLKSKGYKDKEILKAVYTVLADSVWEE